jgi:translation elongation factor EF-Ts
MISESEESVLNESSMEGTSEENEKCIEKSEEEPEKSKSFRVKRRNYDEIKMKEALKNVFENNVSLHGSAKKFNVPYSTLCRRFDKNQMEKPRLGKNTILSKEIEMEIERYLRLRSRFGSPFTIKDTQSLFRNVASHYKIETSLKWPEERYIRRFLKRHKDLRLRKVQFLHQPAALVTNEILEGELDQILSQLVEKGFNFILDDGDGDRVLNLDELNSPLNIGRLFHF